MGKTLEHMVLECAQWERESYYIVDSNNVEQYQRERVILLLGGEHCEKRLPEWETPQGIENPQGDESIEEPEEEEEHRHHRCLLG